MQEEEKHNAGKNNQIAFQESNLNWFIVQNIHWKGPETNYGIWYFFFLPKPNQSSADAVRARKPIIAFNIFFFLKWESS